MKGNPGTLRRGEAEILDPIESIVGREANFGMLSAGGRPTVPRGLHDGGVRAGGEALSLLPSSSDKGSDRHQPPRERARAVAAVPYPTMRSLRLA